MKAFLPTKSGRMQVARALTQFSSHRSTLDAALAALPQDYQGAAGYYCKGPTCVFNTVRPGHPARRSEDGGQLCLWCDPELMRGKCDTATGLELVRRLLSRFQASSEQVHGRAMLLVPLYHKSIVQRNDIIVRSLAAPSTRGVQAFLPQLLGIVKVWTAVPIACGTTRLFWSLVCRARRAVE